MIRSLAVLIVIFSITSCGGISPKPEKIKLTKASYSSLQGWSEANAAPGFKAFRKTCGAINSSKIMLNPVFSGEPGVWRNKCARTANATSAKKYFEDNFNPYLVTYQGSKLGKFTGYYKIEIEASLQKNAIYKYPIYRMPGEASLLKLTRRQIEAGALNGRRLEIAYAKDAADLFFLHIQGSGILRLPDGRKVTIGFAGKNAAQYTGVGRYMLDKGLIRHGNAEEMKRWMRNYPIQAREIMNMNDRYVFFSIGRPGTYGSLGVELTDAASLAVDPYHIPLGVPLWRETTLPDSSRFTRLMNAQDTGSAIKGPIRGDIYFGEGSWAENTASGMNKGGSYYMLLPKEIDAGFYF